jgi:hypothetical protein
MKRLAVLLPLLVLMACDDGSAERQNLAQCMLDHRAKRPNEDGANVGFLRTCMEAHGFILDTGLCKYCAAYDFPEIDPTCYRPDNPVAAWLAHARASK